MPKKPSNKASKPKDRTQLLKGAAAAVVVAMAPTGTLLLHWDRHPDGINGCPAWGLAQNIERLPELLLKRAQKTLSPAEEKDLNKLEQNIRKNRPDLPGDESWVGAEFDDLAIQAKEGEFTVGGVNGSGSVDPGSPGCATTVRGYVVEVKNGGVESCNCRTTDPAYMDTHIFVGPSATSPKKDCIVVEVTPRFRAMVAQQGVDWSTNALKKAFEGQYVRVSGWLFFDKEHIGNSVSNSPNSKQLWRASCWEIHPVTDIQLATIETKKPGST